MIAVGENQIFTPGSGNGAYSCTLTGAHGTIACASGNCSGVTASNTSCTYRAVSVTGGLPDVLTITDGDGVAVAASITVTSGSDGGAGDGGSDGGTDAGMSAGAGDGGSDGGGGVLAVNPSNPTSYTLGTLLFTATGGSGSYIWSIVGGTTIGSTINAATGRYIVGTCPTTCTEKINVVDNNTQASASTTVTIGSALSLSPGGGPSCHFVQSTTSAATTNSGATCGLATTLQPYCWGFNGDGELGIGVTDTSRHVPQPPQGVSSLASIGGGANWFCGVTNAGGVKCWGAEVGYDQTGNSGSTAGQVPTPTLLNGTPAHVTSVAMGDRSACGVTSTGKVYCWGDNSGNELGNTSLGTGTIVTPTLVPGLSGVQVTQVAVAVEAVFAVTSTGSLYAWGSNMGGALGIGSSDNNVYNATLVGLSNISAVSTYHDLAPITCAVANGGLYCWGRELNSGNMDLSPTAVPGLTSGVTQVAIGLGGGGLFICAIANNVVNCLGDNSLGTLGDGTSTTRYTPAPVVGLPSGTIAEITAGVFYACALMGDGTSYCWGANNVAALGNESHGTGYDALSPVVTLCGTGAGYTAETLQPSTFTASGGTPPYTFDLTVNNSGGSVTAAGSTATYVAGTTVTGPAVTPDIVSVTDSTQQKARVNVPVIARVAVAPGDSQVLVGGTQTLLATAGSGIYQFAITSNPAHGSFPGSCNTLNPANTSCMYTAASVGTDTVTMTDSYGVSATATIHVQAVTVNPTDQSVSPGANVAEADRSRGRSLRTPTRRSINPEHIPRAIAGSFASIQ